MKSFQPATDSPSIGRRDRSTPPRQRDTGYGSLKGAGADSRVDIAIRAIRGESINRLAEEIGVSTDQVLKWRRQFLMVGHGALARPSVVDTGQGARLERCRRLAILAIVAMLLFSAGVVTRAVLVPSQGLVDEWHVVHDGYGKAGIEMADDGRRVHYLKPMMSGADPGETHAGLKASPDRFRDFDLQLDMRTVQQLRSPPANPWEVAWVGWQYRDDRHFYYLLLKPNGWEIGKRDPSYPGGQRFLATGEEPAFYFNTWYRVRVRQVGDEMAVWVDDRLLTTFVDTERPLDSGHIILYSEDAYAQFADISISPDPPALFPN